MTPLLAEACDRFTASVASLLGVRFAEAREVLALHLIRGAVQCSPMRAGQIRDAVLTAMAMEEEL